MKGYRINPDKEYVDRIIQGLINKEGYCPCKVLKDEINKCPCVEFIELGKCCCKLWVKEEEDENISKS